MKVKKALSFLGKIPSLINDWRDTIFYSALLAMFVVNSVFALHIPGGLFVSYAVVREMGRTLAWMFFPERNIRYAMMGVFSSECFFLVRRFVFAVSPQEPLVHTINAFFVILYMTVASIALTQAGGFKKLYEAYRDTLFDYPRKIKPPAQRKKREKRYAEATNPAGI